MLVQEIYYITTGTYKMRKELYIIYTSFGGSPNMQVERVLTREELQALTSVNAVKTLPALNVTPKEFKYHESMRK